MEKKDRYFVRWDRITPKVVWYKEEEKEAYRLEKSETSRNLCWVYDPKLNDIPEHGERYPEYTEITEEETEEVKRRLEEENDRIEKELTRNCVKRSRRKTENGIADVVTYSKVSKWRSFTLKEYVEILCGYLAEKGMVFHRIDYSWYDEWGYPKHWSITKKADFRELFKDDPSELEARFSDRENNYVLRGPFLLHTIELEAVPKKTGKELSKDG